MSNSEITPYDPSQASVQILETVSDGLSKYLQYLGLPHEKILVEIRQRQRAINNIQDIIPDLSDRQKASAFYLSKLISASMMGLFDAALNYLWDETIQSLRKKVVRFDISYFYDTAIKDSKKREKFKSEEDLTKLEDWELVSGCEETGIITHLGYQHLDYIRDMRNHASAAHPNHNEITGLQLASWLETCIIEVIAKEPEGAVIEVKKLLKSLRDESLSANDVSPIRSAMGELPEELLNSLMRTVFGMYTDTKLDAKIRRNINLIAKDIFQLASEDMRQEIGFKYSSLEINGEIQRKGFASAFLDMVQGLPYLPSDTLSLKLNDALDELLKAHNGNNNFHNELSPSKFVKSFIPDSGNIPENVIKKYVKVLTICKIGNEYGTSNSAEEIYDDLIKKWSNSEANMLIKIIANDQQLISKLQFSRCQNKLKSLVKSIRINITSKPTQEILNFIESFPQSSLKKIRQDSRFNQLYIKLN